jgi:hypothetical protein
MGTRTRAQKRSIYKYLKQKRVDSEQKKKNLHSILFRGTEELNVKRQEAFYSTIGVQPREKTETTVDSTNYVLIPPLDQHESKKMLKDYLHQHKNRI